MSHVAGAGISTVGTRAPSVTRRRVLATLALVIAVVVVVAVATVLAPTGQGTGAQSNVAPDTSPYPGLSQQADQATRQPDASPYPGLSNQAGRAVPDKYSGAPIERQP